jgi:hypothetical protein
MPEENVRFDINGKISGAEPEVPAVILGRYTWLGTEVDCGNEIPFVIARRIPHRLIGRA